MGDYRIAANRILYPVDETDNYLYPGIDSVDFLGGYRKNSQVPYFFLVASIYTATIYTYIR